ncbi:MAG TPA: hypothetical protein VFA27_01430 [Vicinamibacterales bacterium]|nr:hypothetical protein [Vicinamibacterales bacterium]
MVVNVNASGAGTMTMQDTANFDHAYQGTLAADLTFSGSGTFSFLGTPVPGQLKVTIADRRISRSRRRRRTGAARIRTTAR